MTKKIFFLIGLLASCWLTTVAQGVTAAVTVYKEFQPATIHLADGRLLKVSLANIFLKNSSLLYKSGLETKEANLNTLDKVVFKDRTYYKVDTLLAYHVDSVGNDALLSAQQIDFETWNQQVANNSLFTSMDFGEMIGYTTAELSDEQDLRFPVKNLYFFRLKGKYVLVHERNLRHVLNKEKSRLMESVMTEKGFSWTDEKCLLKLLKIIQ